jgi:hypothetical protein
MARIEPLALRDVELGRNQIVRHIKYSASKGSVLKLNAGLPDREI